MKTYQVKVIETHTATVWVKAGSMEDAKNLAPLAAECEYEALYDCKVLQWKDEPEG